MFIARFGAIGSSNQSSVTSSLLTGLVSYWKLDETSGNALDSVGSNNGTVDAFGRVTQGVTGLIDKAAESSTTSGIEVVDFGSSLTIGTSSWSISLWAKFSTAGRFYFIQWGADGGTNGIRIETSTSPYHGSIIFGWGASYHEMSSGLNIDLTDGSWHHIVATFDRSGNMQIWIDGNAGNTYDISSHSAESIANSTNFSIVSTSGTTCDVIVDEYGLWNRVLTSYEISSLYNSGVGKTYPFS
jgi:hypothetical protein